MRGTGPEGASLQRMPERRLEVAALVAYLKRITTPGGGESMRGRWKEPTLHGFPVAAVLAAILIAIGSAFGLDLLDRSAANVYRTTQGNVRL